MAKVTATIRGNIVTSATVTGWNKSASNVNQTITLWANYGAVCAVFHDGLDVLNNMVKNSAFTLSTGKLSALGRQVVDYVTAHCGQFVKFDSKANAFAFVQFKGEGKAERKIAARGFVDPGAADENGQPVVKFTAQRDENGGNPSCLDFALTFEQFREFSKPKKTAEKSTVTAAKVAALLEKQVKEITESELKGDSADFIKAMAQIDSLRALLVKAGAAAIESEQSARAEIMDTFLPAQSRADDGATLKNEAA